MIPRLFNWCFIFTYSNAISNASRNGRNCASEAATVLGSFFNFSGRQEVGLKNDWKVGFRPPAHTEPSTSEWISPARGQCRSETLPWVICAQLDIFNISIIIKFFDHPIRVARKNLSRIFFKLLGIVLSIFFYRIVRFRSKKTPAAHCFIFSFFIHDELFEKEKRAIMNACHRCFKKMMCATNGFSLHIHTLSLRTPKL